MKLSQLRQLIREEISEAASNPLKEMKTRVGFDVMSVLRKLASTPAFINKATRTNNLLSEELSIEIDEQDSEKDEKEIL